ncbi:FtsX-like permease family protein [Microbispora hainanensis]|uniref:FtsX-like permease family protein n=1 Tax=Microbispora hainanensis TaxID=568844 RepID=A0A544Z4A8_9ACTN|nr:FtsX-like permease family protein [Microbispora hainanensis]TQS23889.1 FtsX-like permease family protein [Microbispora hainanensis]
MSPMHGSGVRAALRISRRNALRSKRRSALILAMIGLPVALAVFSLTALFALAGTDRQHYPIGQADAVVTGAHGWAGLTQDAWGNAQDAQGNGVSAQPGEGPFTQAEVTALLAPGSRVIPAARGTFRYLTPQGYETGEIRQVDLRDPMSRGTFRLTEGRLPVAPGEAVVSAERLNRDDAPAVAPGVTLLVGEERRPVRVVGVAMFAMAGIEPTLATFPGSLPADAFGPVDSELMSRAWLVDSPRPVTWADVRRLNAQGLVVGRAVIDRLPADESPSRVSDLVRAVPWVAIMLLEVVLLAGPAFAVGRLRRSREFALVAVQGGSPAHLRTIAIADGLLFGVVASALGAALGLVAAPLATPLLEWRAGVLLGPFDVPWAGVAMVAMLGVVAGLLAALAPAVAASRTDPVAVLSGRRERGRERAGRPVLGTVLVVAGTAATIASAGHDIAWTATSALVTQLGLVALVPVFLAATARLAARLPLPLRFAARDAVRNRGRTAPAVAAVMTAVVALVSVGVAGHSVVAQRSVLDYAQAPAGALQVTGPDLTPELWDRVRSAVREELPAGVPLIEARMLATRSGAPLYAFVPDDASESHRMVVSDAAGSGGLLVGGEDLLRYVLRREDPGAVAALREGKPVVLNPDVIRQGEVRIELAPATGEEAPPPLTLPAVGVRPTGQGWARVVVSPEVAAKNGYAAVTCMLVVDPADFRTPQATAGRIAAKVERITGMAVVRLETPQTPGDTLFLVVLGIAAAVLVLGMTSVATMLAAVEARPDLETMSAVGAAPRVKRAVVAGQALVIALLGSVAGVLAGLAPGVAAAWRPAPFPAVVVRADGTTTMVPADPAIAIPWALIGLLVVGLPLLAALGGAAFTRSRLPLPRRRAT